MFGFEVAEKFKADNHFRLAEKCCLSCRFGERDWEGEAKCNHPSLDYINDDGEQEHADICADQCDVCDLWEPESKRRKGGKA